MCHFKHTLMLSAGVMLALAGAVPALAETITTKTIVTPQAVENMTPINFSTFDVNNDGILSMPEVGERLFYAFDRDGNEVIDNIEFDKKSVLTITPMEKRTFIFVDYDNNGTVDESAYSYETFLQRSKLMRFDDDRDGLTPAEFINQSFLKLDDNDDHVIDLEEWKEAYIEMVIPLVAEQERYN